METDDQMPEQLLFSVGYGCENRALYIREFLKKDRSVAVILAAVHFEWVFKRTILKLGISPTKNLRDNLKKAHSFSEHRDGNYRKIWRAEVESRIKTNSAFGRVLGKWNEIEKALKCRGEIIHGNGTASKEQATRSVDAFLEAGKKLAEFTSDNSEDIDARLTTRIKERTN